MCLKKEAKIIAKLLQSAGCEIVSQAPHYKVRNDYGQMTFASSPSDIRALQNIRSVARRVLNIDLRDYGWTY